MTKIKAFNTCIKQMRQSQKNILFDFNINFQGFIEKKARGGAFWAEYDMLKEFLSSYSNKYNFYADCICSKNFYTNIICKEFPEFREIKWINISSPKESFNKKILFWTKLLKLNRNNSKNSLIKLFYFLLNLDLKILRLSSFFLPNKIKKNNIDIYQNFTGTTGIPSDIAKSNIKKLAFVHDVLPLTHPQFFFKKKKMKKQMKSFEKKIKSITSDTTIITNSEYSKNEFLKLFPEYSNNKIVVSYLGVDEKKFFIKEANKEILKKYAIPQDAQYFLSLSSLNKRKNLDFLINAFVSFLKKNKNHDKIYLVLAGPKAWLCEDLFNSLENAQDYKNKIIMTGFIDDSDINDIYNGAFSFVFPSLAEGFGLPVVEAMKCGLPVLSSNYTCMPEIYGEGAMGFNPENEAELVEKIEWALRNEKEREELIERGLKRSKEFGWSECVSKMEDEW